MVVIDPAESKKEGISSVPVNRDEPLGSSDPPPSYVSSLSSEGPSESSVSDTSQRAGQSSQQSLPRSSYPVPAPNIPPSNRLLIREQDRTITGPYILDISLPPPPVSARSPDYEEVKDVHMKLETRDGGISPELWIAAQPTRTAERARVVMNSRSGRINTTIHAAATGRPLLSIALTTRDGRILLALPRSFHGHLILKTRDGRSTLSPALTAVSSLLSASGGRRVYAVGPSSVTEEEADEATLESRDGSFNVSFDDEAEPAPGSRKAAGTSGWKQLFGLD